MNFLKQHFTQDIKLRVKNHKERFMRLFYNRYRELLINLIVYKGEKAISTDFLKVENALRNNYQVVIGENSMGNIAMLGVVNSSVHEQPSNIFLNENLNKKDIHFITKFVPEKIDLITHADDCKTGNAIVLKNKTLNYVNDLEILEHYTTELAELVLSRYSLAMQSKIHTFFTSEANDETINKIVNNLYNGVPYIKVTELFDSRDNIHRLETGNIAQNFAELKREYQNKISELNNMLGINSLAVEKESGVSDHEAKSNKGFTTSNANIYLASRNNELKKLNKRYGLNIEAIYNDEVESELMEFAKEIEKEESHESNDNSNGYSTIGND